MNNANHRIQAFRSDVRDEPVSDSLFHEGNDVVASFSSYLTDESRLQGCADRISFPRSESDILAILDLSRSLGLPLTFSGARTGITGGAVPQGGWLVSFEKMNRVLGMRYDETRRQYTIRCQSGITLERLTEMIERKTFPDIESWTQNSRDVYARFQQAGKLFFPPDPTERSATLGGMVACNASGARTYFYGSTRKYISALRMILAEGARVEINRGEYRLAEDRSFELALPDGTLRRSVLPEYRMPDVKNAAGYFVKPGMDLLDLFIGSEGTIGLFSEIEIALAPFPETIIGVIGFFGSEANALKFVRAARGEPIPGLSVTAIKPLALEYFDSNSLNLLRDQKVKLCSASAIPSLPESYHTAVFIEAASTEDDLENTATALMELLEACGSSADTAWTATDDRETEKLKAFRHALPEAINQRIGERARDVPGLTKLGTDFAVPDHALIPIFDIYRRRLNESGLDYVIFGHIGNNHVHINILPRTLDEYASGKELYMHFARDVVAMGGTVSGEHGIGKLKKPLLQLMYGQSGIEAMQKIKRVFDPHALFNRGNMFDTECGAA